MANSIPNPEEFVDFLIMRLELIVGQSEKRNAGARTLYTTTRSAQALATTQISRKARAL